MSPDRLNEKEEEVLNYLTEYFHEEKSSLLKKSMFEFYEDIQDMVMIYRTDLRLPRISISI